MRHVAFTIAVVLLTAQLAVGQCGPYGCPSPYSQGYSQYRGGSSWGRVRQETPRPPRQSIKAPVSTSTPPEWLCHVYRNSGMLIYRDDRVGVVLTAYHVLKGGPRTNIQVQFPDGNRYQGRVYETVAKGISADKLYDCACIEIAAPEAEPIKMAEVKPDAGAAVWVVGYGAGRYQVRSARVVGYGQGTWRGAGSEAGTMLMAGNQSAIPGDSGGALLNRAGQLVGVISCSDHNTSNTSTTGPSLARIHALCSDERFRWPWRDDVRRISGDIDRIDRDKADRSEIPPLPPPSGTPLPPAPRLDEGDVKRIIEGSQERDAFGLADAIDENRQRLMALEQWNPLLEELKDAKAKLLDMDPEKLKTDLGKVVQTDLKANLAKAEEAAKAAKDLAETVPGVAEKAAATAVENAEPGLIERIGKRTDGLLTDRLDNLGLDKMAAIIRGLKGWIFGSYGGLLLLAGVVLWVFKDVRDYIKTGGEDKLTIQKLADRLENLTKRTRNPVDDYASAGLNVVADRLAGLLDRLAEIESEPAPARKRTAKKTR